MSSTSLNRPIVEIVCNLFFFFFVCVWSMGAIFKNLSPSVTLKIGVKVTKI